MKLFLIADSYMRVWTVGMILAICCVPFMWIYRDGLWPAFLWIPPWAIGMASLGIGTWKARQERRAARR